MAALVYAVLSVVFVLHVRIGEDLGVGLHLNDRGRITVT